MGHTVGEFSQVWGWGWGYQGREVGLGTQLSLQAAAPLGGWVGVHESLGSPHFAGLFLFPGLEALHKKTAPSCSTYLMSMGQDGRAGPALAMLGGIPKNPGMEHRGGRAGPPLPLLTLGWGPLSALTHSYLICCMLYMGVFISCLMMLCSCGLSTSEETVF